MGEGSGVIILEELEFATRRGAPIYAELVGYGMSADAYPHHRAVGRRRRRACASWTWRSRSAGVDAGRRWTTSTRTAPRRRINDKLETLAIKRLFGEHARKLAISSTKSMTGHLLGAAGGLEAGITALADQAPDRPADDQLRDARSRVRPRLRAEHKRGRRRSSYALSNSFGFGGTNGALLFKKFEE